MEQKQLTKQRARGLITQDCQYCSYGVTLTSTLPIPFVFTNHTPEQVYAKTLALSLLQELQKAVKAPQHHASASQDL
jgi:hypothetical protein